MANPGYTIAVGFDVYNNSKLASARFYVYADPLYAFNWSVYNDSGSNMPDSILYSGTTTPTTTGWHNLTLENLTVPNRFYVALTWSTSFKPRIGFDNSNPDNQSYDSNILGWVQTTSEDYMIRATVIQENGTLTTTTTTTTSTTLPTKNINLGLRTGWNMLSFPINI